MKQMLFPRIEFSNDRHYLVTAPATDYAIPDDPIKVLGLMCHLGEKRWADGKCMQIAIEHIARIRGWDIHGPY